MVNVNTIFKGRSNRDFKDPRTGRVFWYTTVVVHEVLNSAMNQRRYVVKECAEGISIRRKIFDAPGYMDDNCGDTAAKEARKTAREWLVAA